MTATTSITTAQLSRLVGLPTTPAIIDVRIDEDFRADPRMLPGSVRRDFRRIDNWMHQYHGKSTIVVCQRGQKLSEGTAAWLRYKGIAAKTLEDGFEGWRKSGELLVRTGDAASKGRQRTHGLGDPSTT